MEAATPARRGTPLPPIPAGLQERPRAALSPETPPEPGCRKWRGARRAREARAGDRAQPSRGVAPGRPGPGGKRRPAAYPSPTVDSPAGRPGSRRAHRLHGRSHVVVALRLLGQPRPLQQLLPVAHVARGSASPSALHRSLARPPARPRVAAEAAAAHAHWLAGRPEAQAAGSAAARALSLARPARCGWRRGRGGGRRGCRVGGMGGREDACAMGAAGPGGGSGRGEGRVSPNGLFQGDVTYYK